MQSWVALIASAAIGGLVLLSFGRFSNEVMRDTYIDTLDNAAYGTLDGASRLIDYDFSRIGLGVNDPSINVLTQADLTDLRYVLDSNADGTLETMRYYLSTVAAASSTPNPNDRLLYRVVNGVTQTVTGGVIDFQIKYFDGAGSETNDLTAIRTFVVYLELESDFGYDGEYPRLLWQGKITPPSLVTY
jgi:hypothetical protein